MCYLPVFGNRSPFSACIHSGFPPGLKVQWGVVCRFLLFPTPLRQWVFWIFFKKLVRFIWSMENSALQSFYLWDDHHILQPLGSGQVLMQQNDLKPIKDRNILVKRLYNRRNQSSWCRNVGTSDVLSGTSNSKGEQIFTPFHFPLGDYLRLLQCICWANTWRVRTV